MNSSAILFGIVPLVAFVIIDTFAGLKAALVTTVIIAVLEAISSLWIFGEIDSVTISSLVLVIILAATSYKTKNALYLKTQPVLLSALMSAILIITYFMDEPILLTMATKYKEYFPENMQTLVNHPVYQKLLITNTWVLGIGLLIHALITGIAAFKLSNWWWIAIRGIGFYVILFLSALISRLLI